MVEHHLLEPLLAGSEDTLRSSEVPSEKCESTGPAPESGLVMGSEEATTAEATVEDATFDGIPKEVIEMIGAYDSDCAGGCG
jgi:hypothetical protein